MAAEVRIGMAEFAANPTGTLERVIEGRQTAIVERDGVAVARVSPIAAGRTKARRPAQCGRAALRAAFGGWRDVDTDRLVEEVYADRRTDDRPPVTM